MERKSKTSFKNFLEQNEDDTQKDFLSNDSSDQNKKTTSNQFNYSQGFWEDYDASKPVIFLRNRPKGLGDIISSLSAVQALKKKREDISIGYQTYDHFFPLLIHPNLDNIYSIDSKLPLAHIIDISSTCARAETVSIEKTGTILKSRNEMFTDAIGLHYDFDKPILTVLDDSVKSIAPLLSKTSEHKGHIGLALRSAERWKDYPHNKLLVKQLLKEGYTVYSIDKDKKLPIEPSGSFSNITGLSLTELIAFVSKLDLLISPDTGTLHIAEALGIECIGIFGSMGTERRKNIYGKNTVTYVSSSVCNRQPCFYNRCKGLNQIQPCLYQIHPSKIIKQVRQKLNSE